MVVPVARVVVVVAAVGVVVDADVIVGEVAELLNAREQFIKRVRLAAGIR